MPPSDNEGRIRSMMVEGKKMVGMTLDDYLDMFAREADRIYRMFYAVNIPCEWLHPDEMATYLHSTVSMYTNSISMQ